jgi:ATP-binding cassette subfamily B protein
MANTEVDIPPVKLQPSRSFLKLLWRVYGYLKPYSAYTIGSYVSVVLVMALNIVIPQIIRWTIDNGISGQKVAILVWSVIGLVVLSVVKGVLNYFQGVWSEKASQNVAYDIRNAIQEKLTLLSFSFHDQSETGELLSRAVQDVERIRFLTGRATIRIVEGSLLLLATAVTLIAMDVKLGLMSMMAIPLLVYVALHFGSRLRPLSLQVQKQLAVLTTTVEQNLRGARVVKAYAQEDAEITRFASENERWFKLANRSAAIQAVNGPLLILIANISVALILWYGGMQVMNGALTLGALIAFTTYMGQLIEPVRRLGMIIPAVSIAGSAAERIFDILDTVPDVRDEPGAKPMPPLTGHVRFEHVSFGYRDHRVLQDVDFEAQPGQRIALLGMTGSGKSSIISLIPRFYDPTAGRILIDGMDIRHVTLFSLRSQIGVVLQETTLFAASIRENIAFGSASATEKDIEAAARAAQAHDFIMESPKGYDTRVGERGVTLSGGQKQRIAIARALLLNPRVLLLDDATASVDSETEQLIQTAFETLMEGRTSFVIAHRLSTVRKADLILVLENGRIAARGTHETLLNDSGLYRDIFTHQLQAPEVKP